MKQRFIAVLILILTVVLIGVVLYLSTHDKVEQALAINQYQLSKGRIVHLIGIEAPSQDEFETAGLDYDAVIQDITSLVTAHEVTLEFESSFEPDSSSVDLHAYMVLHDGSDLGKHLLEKGLARANEEHTHPQMGQYLEYEQAAADAGVGIWNRSDDEEVQDDEATDQME